MLLPFLVFLGFWQLDRAEEKRVLAERYAQRTALPPISVSRLVRELPRVEWADRQVSVRGRFAESRYLLLDNRLRDGRFGYEVIALLETPDQLVPINLGWVAGDPARRTRPDIELPEYPNELQGRVYLPAGEAYVLEQDAAPQALPALIQSFDAARLAEPLSTLLDSTVAPFEVRVSSDHPLAFRADWQVVNVSPEKHTGYAVQWFTMAVVLGLAFLWRSSNCGNLIARVFASRA
ncbi:conserved hypothetical protein [Luminiphilus syltensis NOR5-1B]|uniref:SURF1-like protein n=1 Tax=Luminiphilus syltensis NOR5-1B TaxID=565045 RepID=B8KUJ0_9GAMM|nr:conserved hypothetical protein [Luminiphilus syltensis NOR5-1B]